MKLFHIIPLLFLTACSTTPRLTLRPQPSPPMENTAVRYPEVVRAYHVGRYIDPNDDLVMHEQHAVYRVEDNTRWNLHPGLADGNLLAPPPRDAAFAPAPVNDAILAEVNSQRLATTQIMLQSQTLSAALVQFQAALSQAKTNVQETAILRASLNEMKQRLAALEAAQGQPPSLSTTNDPADPLSP
jgi:hypothetical protein